MTEAACGVSAGVTGVFHHSQLLWRPPTPNSVYLLCSPTSVCLFLGMLETVCGDLWQYDSCHVYCVYGCEKMKQIADVYYLCFDAVHLFLALACLELTFFDLHRNKWRALDASDINSDRPNSTSCPSQPGVALILGTCQAVHGKWHATDAIVTQLTILFLTLILICATRSVTAWSSLPESVLLPFTHNFVSFNKSETLKSEEQAGRRFPAQRLMLFTHCYTMTCPNRWAQIFALS